MPKSVRVGEYASYTKDPQYVFKIMEWYSASAKAFVALSTATLALTVTFREKVLGSASRTVWESAGGWTRNLVVASWVSLVVAIAAGTVYQYLAVKFVERKVEAESAYVFAPLKALVDAPGWVYGTMLVAFALGAAAFVASAALQLF